MSDDRQQSPRSRRQFHYVVNIDGVSTSLSFQEVSGLGVDTQLGEFVVRARETFATANRTGIAKPGTVTLKRGTAARSDSFSQWIAMSGTDAVRRARISIKLLNESGAAVASWTLANAFPRKITAPDLKANANEVAIESIELAHEGLTIVDDD